MEHMKLISAAIVLMSMASDALAQSHLLTLQMSCYGARELVATQGGIVLSTGVTTYERNVAAVTQCVRGENLDPAWVPTADTPQCPIGYRCVQRTRPSGG